MARKLRLHVPGGFYHVTLRGNHRQPVFFTMEDRDLLDRIVARVVTRLGVRLHAYCWMTNHLHLLAQVSEAPLGRMMLRIASHYARIVQTRLGTTGHLFERRYHAVLVDADSYLLTLVRYIHLNPVRAGLSADPEAYPWSSHRNYLGQRQQAWVTTDLTLNLLEARPDAARARYREYMGMSAPEHWGTGVLRPHREHGQILGGDAFVARVMASRLQRRLEKTLEELVTECSQRFNIAPEALVSPGRDRALAAARAWIAHEAVSGRVASISEVARRLGRSETAIRRLMTRRPHRDPKQ